MTGWQGRTNAPDAPAAQRSGADARSSTLRSRAQLVLLVIGVVSVGGAAGGILGGWLDSLRFRSRFAADAERRVSDAGSRLAMKLWIGHALRGFFLGSEVVTDSEFEEFARGLRLADGEVRSCAFVRSAVVTELPLTRKYMVELRSPANADLGVGFETALQAVPQWATAVSIAERNDRPCILELLAAGEPPPGAPPDELALVLPVQSQALGERPAKRLGLIVTTFRAGDLLRSTDGRNDTGTAAPIFILDPDRNPGQRVVVDLSRPGATPFDRLPREELERLATRGDSIGAARELAPALSKLRVVCLDPSIDQAFRADRYSLAGALLGALLTSGVWLLLKHRERAAELARRRLEELVERRTADLEIANSDLEAFAHTVSHDLRAPLRTIEGFAEALGESLSTAADDNQRRQLSTLQRSASRASEIVASLLSLSKWTRVPLEFRDLDTGAIARECGEHVLSGHPQRRIELIVGDLPRIRGDEGLMRQVFVNLISNAVKYTRDRAAARIEIRGRVLDDRVEIEVGDNGIGIDAKLASRLFKPFQRLPNASDYEGSGIGLSLVARIISRHGGTIGADGKLGVGATIRFTLPRPDSYS